MADTFQERTTSEIDPYFDTTLPSNITGLAGETVQLACRVKNIGNRTVSWVRHRDIHLLTVGTYTYTSDQRFEAMHKFHTEEWILRIRYPQRKDSGIYECQISTTPPIGHPVRLTIVEDMNFAIFIVVSISFERQVLKDNFRIARKPVTEIVGGPHLFINKGSTINLTCYVRHAPEPPSTIIWIHNHQAINFDSPRGGISLVTEKGPVTSSRLLIQKANFRDSGLYTCSPNNTHPNSVHVHIMSGKKNANFIQNKLYVQVTPHVTDLNSSETFFKRTDSLKKATMCVKPNRYTLKNLITICDNFYFRRLLRDNIKTHSFTQK
ncbi:hypothetical protein ALC60_11001 [Trachymyrmex zeteki]|uniref:Ig-like domain-containing protein n=1 Tax=Mycetomoellerius zeteki TaxID=64791 RepID=A0A151WPN4_9HYME|nr:hypothetical protein ALC60_11001 [Trachymyrmex zeteki]